MSAAQPPPAPTRQGQAWSAFCDALKAAGEEILRPGAPDAAILDDLDRAEGYRYLTRLLRIALEMHLEHADPEAPGFLCPSHETAKIGADNPDNHYLMARIDGRRDYLIEGRRGSVAYLSFGSQKGGYESDGRMTPTGFVDAADLAPDADGGFALWLGQKPPAALPRAHWLPLEPESNAVIVRQTFVDRTTERPAELSIRRADGGGPRPLDEPALAAALERTTAFVSGTARLFHDWARGFAGAPNTLPLADQALCQAVGGDPNIVYYHGHWRLAPDEALVIHLPEIPACRLWNLQINNWWMESLDYRFHRIHHNQHSAVANPDGSVTLVLAHADPGHPNHLETAGHAQGTMCLRWVGAQPAAEALPSPQTHVCSQQALPGLLARLGGGADHASSEAKASPDTRGSAAAPPAGGRS